MKKTERRRSKYETPKLFDEDFLFYTILLVLAGVTFLIATKGG